MLPPVLLLLAAHNFALPCNSHAVEVSLGRSAWLKFHLAADEALQEEVCEGLRAADRLRYRFGVVRCHSAT